MDILRHLDWSADTRENLTCWNFCGGSLHYYQVTNTPTCSTITLRFSFAVSPFKKKNHMCHFSLLGINIDIYEQYTVN